MAVFCVLISLTFAYSNSAKADRGATVNALENALNDSIKEARVNIDKSESRVRTGEREILSTDEEVKVIKIRSKKVNVR